LHRLYHPRACDPPCTSKVGHSRGHVLHRPAHSPDCLNPRTPIAPGSRGHGSVCARGHRSASSGESPARTGSIESKGTRTLDCCTGGCMRREMGRQEARSKPHRLEVCPIPLIVQSSISLTPHTASSCTTDSMLLRLARSMGNGSS
jgi:hypothetical protein